MVPSFPVRPIASSSRRLVRILCPIVEAFMLAVLDAGHDLPLGGSVAAQFVGDQHTRRPQLPFQKLAEQAFGGLLVAPALDQNVENEALLVDRAPEPVLRAGDRDDDLIKVPFVAAAGARRRIRLANSRPNFRPHCRLVS